MAKTVNLTVRLDEKLKDDATAASTYLGVSVTTFITETLHQMIELARKIKRRKSIEVGNASKSREAAIKASRSFKVEPARNVELFVLDQIEYLNEEGHMSDEAFGYIRSVFYRRFVDGFLPVPSELSDEERLKHLANAVQSGLIDEDVADKIRFTLSVLDFGTFAENENVNA